MEKLYDRADIYDLLENDSRYEITKGHWQYLLKGKPVRSLLEVITALRQMDALVAPGGYLYFDLRNWDKIRGTKQRFYTYNPSFHGNTRVNLVQVWDHNSDGTIDFNLLFTFEKENRIFQKEHFIEHYNPVSQRPLLEELRAMGYTDVEIRLVPAQWGAYTDEDDWYCVMARKPKEREAL